MTNPAKSIILVVVLLLVGCVDQKQNKGFITPESIETKLDFTTNKTVVVLPVMFDGVLKKYIFDTGADLSVVNRDKITGKTTKVNGAGGKKQKLGSEVINSLKIGSTEFKNTCAYNGSLAYLANQIPDFGGIIGQSIISKANWLIDYPNKNIQISIKPLELSDYITVNMNDIRDPHVDLTIDGETYSALVDLGSSVAFSVPENSDLGKKLLAKYTFLDNTREIFRIGGVENVVEKVGVFQKMALGNSNFDNVTINILPTSQIKIGNAFFKDCKLYIDNTNKVYKFNKSK